MNWKLTLAACGEPEIIEKDDEDLRRGYSLLRELAESDVYLVEVEPGRWLHHGADPGNSGPGR